MNEQLVRAFLTVMVNDQAYLYALIQRLEYNLSSPIAATDEQFEQWQTEWKELFTDMVHDLAAELGVEEFLEDLEEDDEASSNDGN